MRIERPMASRSLITCSVIAIAFILASYLSLGIRRSSGGVWANPRHQDQDSARQRRERGNEMANKQMTQEELSRLLKEGEEKGYITGNLPNDPRELDRVVQAILQNMVYQESSEVEKGTVTGLQQLILKQEPDGPWNETTDRRLPLFFEGGEWSALFHDVLRSEGGDPFMPG